MEEEETVVDPLRGSTTCVEIAPAPVSSLPRRRESSYVKSLWIPAFAGMTFLEAAYIIRRE